MSDDQSNEYLRGYAIGLHDGNVKAQAEASAWMPIETKPKWQKCEERGLYTHNGDGLFYFKPTHWRPLSSSAAS